MVSAELKIRVVALTIVAAVSREHHHYPWRATCVMVRDDVDADADVAVAS